MQITMNEAVRETISPPMRARSVPLGSSVIVGLRGGGVVEGCLARRLPNAMVITTDGADVVIIETASRGVRVKGMARS